MVVEHPELTPQVLKDIEEVTIIFVMKDTIQNMKERLTTIFNARTRLEPCKPSTLPAKGRSSPEITYSL